MKIGRRVGRQAQIKATADSAVLHAIKETPPTVGRNEHNRRENNEGPTQAITLTFLATEGVHCTGYAYNDAAEQSVSLKTKYS